MSVPPPTDNVGTAAWYRAGNALDAVDALEERIQEKLLLEFGQIAAKIRELKLASRRSGHDLREVKDEQEVSKVTHLKEQLRQAEEEIARRQKAAADLAKKWGNRSWSLVAALLLLVAGALIERFVGR